MQPIAIGVENYKTIIENHYYYIDKTWMLKELSDQKGTVNLFTRPRRFGKTLTLSMVRAFFEDERTDQGEKIDNSRYFAGKKIMAAGDKYISEMGIYPVIHLSLKSARQPDYGMAYGCLKDEIIREFDRHSYVLLGDQLSGKEKEDYRRILNETAEPNKYATALKLLSFCLKKYHGRNAIILIDEYDVPLENAYLRGFYNRMIDFIRSLFESALKTNDALELAVVTGCLRISKESVFTGLNNLEIHSILGNCYAKYFGFTGEEVEQMLGDYGLTQKMPEVKRWYDGYLFGETEIYNPWSITNYVKTAISESQPFPKPYWSNTSSNSIIRELVEKADSDTKAAIEQLIAGKTIEKPVHEDITYEDIHRTQDHLWNFLLFTGYLKVESKRFEGRSIYLTMSIPNEEVLIIYEDTIKEWFDKQVKAIDFSPFYRAILSGDCSSMQKFLKENLRRTISYYDSQEAFYHGVLAGFLAAMPDYTPQSNREYGNGRPDLVMVPYDEEAPVVIVEIKVCKRFTDMADGCRRALEQIEERDYAAPFLDKGYARILKYGICFCEKTCMVDVS
ncbi:AAA family ATPase [Frisingicoccus sp.]|uniref:AAA family ATPase n=1 Tax=Frisingicoccus sp. TaxID=1918627 RepID=UPI002A7FD6EE|nr:AAA family ATPase [Frisingicoccus sp.]MDY4922016.1 AAA family ATPase [Frisingicoccus sp.]